MNDSRPHDDLLWQHLETLPAFRAVLRAVEARFYQNIDLPEPILDLGCGDGNFTELTFPDRTLAAGIDPWWNPLNKAQKINKYEVLLQSLGDHMPFPDNHFASIISNSVLEHIPDIQPVLKEVNRVMQPDGRLVITMPNHNYTNYLDGALFLEGLGLKGLANQYRRFFNFIARHAHTDSAEHWAVRLAQAGFTVEQWQYYFSKDALHALEWGHVQGLPSAIIHALTGHWIVAPWKSSLGRTERWLRPFYEEAPDPDGTMVLIIARKTSIGPVEASLPAAQPVTIRREQEIIEPVENSPDQPGQPQQRIVLSEQQFADDSQTTTQALPTISSTSLRIILFVLALFSTFIGQVALGNAPPGLTAALPWFGLAILFLGAFSKITVQKDLTLSFGRFLPTQTINRRRWLALIGLFLSFMAYTIVKNPGPSTQPLFAIYLWIIAAGLTAYALWPQSQISAPQAPSPRLPWELPAIITLTLIALLVRLISLTNHPFILSGSEASFGLDALAAANGQLQNPFATGWLTNPTLPFFILALPVKLFGPTTLGIRLFSPIIGAATVPALYFTGRRWFGAPVALIAAVLLTGSHIHLHYSRLGLTNIWDPLLMLLVMGAIYSAWQNGRRPTWLLAGLLVGLTPYLFTTAHLFPFILPLVILALFLNRPYPPGYLRNLTTAAIMALVVALPQLFFYRANPGLYMDRANTLGIFQSNWFLEESARTGKNTADVLTTQLQQSLLAFQANNDTSNAYTPGTPLLPFWPAVFFSLGLGLVLWRLRQLRYQLLLIWLAATLFGAAFLLQSPPSSHRLLIAVPAVYLFIALALGWLGQHLLTFVRLNRAYLLPVLVVFSIFLSSSDLAFYFGQYRSQHRFGDRNTEIAYEMANYLHSLDGNWEVNFHGPPNMYVGFPTFPYLLADLNEEIHLTDVLEAERPQPSPGNTVYLFIPERSAELGDIEALYPNGRVLTFEGYHANPLFFAYEIQQ